MLCRSVDSKTEQVKSNMIATYSAGVGSNPTKFTLGEIDNVPPKNIISIFIHFTPLVSLGKSAQVGNNSLTDAPFVKRMLQHVRVVMAIATRESQRLPIIAG